MQRPLGLPGDRVLVGDTAGERPTGRGGPSFAFREQLRARCGIAGEDAAQTRARKSWQRTCRTSLLPPVRASEVAQQLAEFSGSQPPRWAVIPDLDRGPRSAAVAVAWTQESRKLRRPQAFPER